MKDSITSLIILLLLAGALESRAQIDPHFSQYYAFPLWLNPALTGVMDGQSRMTANFRDQWAGVDGGYKTTAISGDTRLSDKIALGANILSQKAGTAGYNHLTAQGSFAYQVAVSSNGYHKLNMGLQAGLINRSFDVSKLQMDNQYNTSTGFDPGMSTGESFENTGGTAFDASAGIFYYNGTPSGRANPFAGLSVSHLTQSSDPFTPGSQDTKMPLRYNLHGGVRLGVSNFLDITPHFIYIKQQKSQIKALGTNFEFNLQADYSLIIGAMYRMNDAAVGNIGFYAKNLVIGISYDHTTTSLQKTGNPGGSYELSISYIFKNRLSARDEKCPRL
ncbi:PorP/SprF family type IX secretion system membrane protein [Pedobacter psychroterrae]|uniref:Type IX secretion system membrane protein PorP/SprF n=1 Tax=Pedobacter psychroterrae TaxID=2530453 RepID=A0A4R0NM84_9SPHI|nr:PorP/SprF family type IX secretion system membrane protein [Pedobacter psychroterrae]TCD00424.1 type IX secretion system membrane protein PorP/SprF [Pedobacter psychroterrae]